MARRSREYVKIAVPQEELTLCLDRQILKIDRQRHRAQHCGNARLTAKGKTNAFPPRYSMIAGWMNVAPDNAVVRFMSSVTG